jgi:hypothetical protein
MLLGACLQMYACLKMCAYVVICEPVYVALRYVMLCLVGWSATPYGCAGGHAFELVLLRRQQVIMMAAIRTVTHVLCLHDLEIYVKLAPAYRLLQIRSKPVIPQAVCA